MSEKIKDWTSKRGQAKGSITRIASFADNMNKDTRVNEVSSRLELLERAFNAFEEADAKLTALDCASEIVEIESKYLSLKVKLNEFLATRATSSVSIIDQFNEVMARTTAQQDAFLSKFTDKMSTSLNQSFLNQSSDEPHFTARLPRLQVPTFDGDYKEFYSFKDLFTAVVHNKSYLANAEKFQYLRNCLKGEPAELIRHLPISDANYEAAWSKICDRYDKMNIAISHFIQTFLDIQPVKEKSAKRLRHLHNVADQVIRGLQAMGTEAETRDHWLLHILLMKTDAETQQAWALSTDSKQYRTFDTFLQFINNRCDGLEPCEASKSYQSKIMTARSHTASLDPKDSSTVRPCPFCQEPHRLFECERFRELESTHRRNEVLNMNVCFNCLSTTHRVNRCQSRRSCTKCGRRHHSLLHDGVTSNANSTSHSAIVIQERPSEQPLIKVNSTPIANSTSHPCGDHQEIGCPQLSSNKDSNAKTHLACTGYAILPTAMVNILDRFGRSHECSALLDSGSQVSFISERCVERLQLPRHRANIIVSGLATSNTTTKGKTTIVVRSRFNNSSQIQLNAFILSHITTTSQYEGFENPTANQFNDLQLADPTYFKGKTIDILIGADYFFHIMKQGQVATSPTSPIAFETTFGWVISGQSQSKRDDSIESPSNAHIILHDENNLDAILQRCWELEAVGTENVWNEDEHKCELHFKATTKRDNSGRFIVANRTADIHKLVPTAIWKHVNSGANPADLATRGIKPIKLISNELWWSGPKWLYTHDEPWPKVFEIKETKEERRSNIIGLQANTDRDNGFLDEMIDKKERWMKLVRIVSTILRFISNLRNPNAKKAGFLTTEELNEAEFTIIKHIQEQAFTSDLSNLRAGKQLKSKSALLMLSPFIDHKGLLRVGGRLKNATCSYATKHPLVIPQNHKVSMMILNYLHVKHLHPGPSLLTSLSRMKYWIIGVRRIVRTVCRKCVICFRYSTHTSTQLMGNLPGPRVTPSRPFSQTGVDYAGPIMLASKRGRGSKLTKGYMVIFVCLCTKALHIEVAGDMTTATFMGALRRFTSRRGVPNQMLSDNGSNFRGANHLLSDIYRIFQTDEFKGAVHQYVTEHQIKWSFIPPLAPNFGGIWERAVRSIKAHLVRVVGNSHLTYEEMATVLAQIECILNSRPLCLINNEDPTNIDALTPGHFLIHSAPGLVPDNNYIDIASSRLSRWQLVQQLVQSYWKRYSRDYLHTLQQRTTAKCKGRNLQVNDVVLVKDEANPPGSWPLGKIVEVHPGNDGIVRVATIKTKQSIFKRPISKLFRLPLDDDDHIERPLKPSAFNEGELCS